MAFATRRAHVRDVREDLDERTELRYHESRLSCKGFGSWGRAGEARPHVEQNPCTRFGLDLQPLSEKCMVAPAIFQNELPHLHYWKKRNCLMRLNINKQQA